MASGLAATLHELRQSGGKAFIPYLTAGFPDRQRFEALLGCLRTADVVEVGLPFSDPVADGPTLCAASDAALAGGMHAGAMFEVLEQRRQLPPIVVMTYLNPVLAYGVERFLARARDCGVAGVLVTDLPPEDGDDLLGAAARHDIASVLLVAPTTSDARMASIAARATGFVYCVSVKGTTGARTATSPDAQTTVARVRAVTDKPVVVGFGISTPEHVRSTCRYADGVVVGSALMDVVRKHAGAPDLVQRFTTEVQRLAAAAHT